MAFLAVGLAAPAPAGWFTRRRVQPVAPDHAMPAGRYERAVELGAEADRFVSLQDREADADSLRRQSARSQYLLGVWLLAEEQFLEAQAALEASLRDNPGERLTRVARAQALLGQGKNDECVAACEEILKEDPRMLDAHLLLATAHEKAGRHPQAIEAYRQGLTAWPDSLALLEPLGRLYYQQGDVRGVVEIFERVHERLRRNQRRNLYVMMVLCRFYEFSQQTEKAIDLYGEALRVYPDQTGIHAGLAELFLGAGRRDEALETCKKGLIRNPQDPKLQALFERAAGSTRAIAEQYRRFADEYDQLSEIQLLWAQRALERLRDLKSAEEGFQRALAFDPSQRDALQGLARIAVERNRPDEAVTYYQRLIAAWPHESDAHKGLAAVYAKKNQWDKAAAQYEALIALAPADADAYLKLSLARERLGQADRALEAARAGVARAEGAPARALLQERLGELLLSQGDMAEAVTVLRDALEGRPRDPKLYLRLMNACLAAKDLRALDEVIARGRETFADRRFEFEALLAEVYRENRMSDEAIEALRRAIEINPDVLALHEQLALQLTAAGRFAEAEQALRAASDRFAASRKWEVAAAWAEFYLGQKRYAAAVRTLEPRVAELRAGESADLGLKLLMMSSYAVALHEEGRRDEALRVCEEMLGGAQGEDELPVLRAVGYCYCDLKAWARAREVFEKVVARDAGNADDLFQLGAICHELKDTIAAEAHLRRAIDLNPRHVNALNHLGFLFAEEGRNLNEAIGLIERALQIRPKAGYIIDSLGWAYFKKGELDKAIEYLEQAARLSPDAEIHEHLGDALLKKGEVQKAIDNWEEALRREAGRPGVRQKIEEARRAAGAPPAR